MITKRKSFFEKIYQDFDTALMALQAFETNLLLMVGSFKDYSDLEVISDQLGSTFGADCL